jgi:Uma2 family endonuclease
MRLAGMLGAACPEDLCALAEPAVQLTSTTEFDPDLVVVPIDVVGGAKFTDPPLLVIEVRSPSTALIDLNQKKAAYERFGVSSYCVVNPDPAKPEVTIFELRDGHYALAGVTTTPLTVTVDRPYKVTIDPARLASGLRQRSTEER